MYEKKADPGPLGVESLMKAALHYLERFAASRDGVRRVLERRVARSDPAENMDAEAVSSAITAVLDRLTDLGYLDDAFFAESRARSLVARGVSARGVRSRLRQKGVSPELVEQAMSDLAADRAGHGEIDPDLTAAVIFARRRRIGPWGDPESRSARRYRDMAALARRGFGTDVIRHILDACNPDDLESAIGPL
ncbi:RecX family transcriptional regulator [Haematospirillum jordaniae]|uniref:regulatory protein RecX n=1 Tax=Haematospirillum jordaniae TaxID=1549855 RepID=UPI001432BCF1|nr:regulatory protein RecX [Haematospirillum jordaniae]NKD85892.1 RecX family transcriptional regulator [Haematospirillum jordaniae]